MSLKCKRVFFCCSKQTALESSNVSGETLWRQECLKNWQNGNLFHKIVSEIIDEKKIQDSLKAAVAASYACHTSIKAGEKLSEPEMRTLIKRLLKTRKPNACPHGRPIIVRIPLSELDRHFERS